jgi:glycosyltransferase involved in cell wall biosynthesis
MATADIGLVPKRNDPFGGEAFSTKILEFMSLGVPVILSETKIDKFYFNDSVVKFFRPEDINNLAESMLRMIKDQSLRENLAGNALKFVEDFSWEKRKWEYLGLVDRLTSSKIHKS